MIIPETAIRAVVVNCVFTSLAFIFVCMRLGTRTLLLKNIGIDDYLITGAMVSSIGFLAIMMLQIKAGLGRQVTFPELPGFLYALWATVPVYSFCLVLIKLSITVQLYRVLRTPKMQKFLRVYLICITVSGLWTVLSTVFNCWPVEYYWNFATGMAGSCMDKSAITFTNAGLNIFTDVILIAVPIPLLWRLQIPRRQKIVLMCLFGVGTFTCIISVVRLQALYQISIAPPAEQSIQGVNIAIWSGLEINVAIMCASVPALKPLVVKFFPKMLLSELYARTKGAAYYANHKAGTAGGGSNTGGSNAGSRQDHLRSGGGRGGSALRSANRAEIQVEQSFEMKSVPMTAMDLDDGGGKTSSRDGSEKNLVVASWQDEYYSTPIGGKKVTITSHPREIV
ncbi:hypothetical protein B0T22DRAFT_538324 [Podospora appendiculata]|uniref:Rhodopsin domain-containing protein n=1 Tax=Podospora appendiculata TaxID=314037 RepID=A0AAE0X6E9_9PEZI|nr:hypothetical protein B0T22DRAFT_538324 [Podospora appendiculata]